MDIGLTQDVCFKYPDRLPKMLKYTLKFYMSYIGCVQHVACILERKNTDYCRHYYTQAKKQAAAFHRAIKSSKAFSFVLWMHFSKSLGKLSPPNNIKCDSS